MRIFLKLKHWQLFLIWMLTGILFAATIYAPIWFLTVVIYDFALVGWIYSIGKVTNGLNEKNRIYNYREDLWFLLLFISIIPFGYFSHSLRPTNGFLMFGIIIFESVVGFKLVNFSAKAICQFEKNKNLKFGDYVSEFLMIIFLPIGIWKLQPKLNKIIERKI